MLRKLETLVEIGWTHWGVKLFTWFINFSQNLYDFEMSTWSFFCSFWLRRAGWPKEFVYVRKVCGPNGPYELELMPFQEVSLESYTTLSPAGLTRYGNGLPVSFVPLQRWLNERESYRALRKLRFFQVQLVIESDWKGWTLFIVLFIWGFMQFGFTHLKPWPCLTWEKFKGPKEWRAWKVFHENTIDGYLKVYSSLELSKIAPLTDIWNDDKWWNPGNMKSMIMMSITHKNKLHTYIKPTSKIIQVCKNTV